MNHAEFKDNHIFCKKERNSKALSFRGSVAEKNRRPQKMRASSGGEGGIRTRG